MAYKLISIILTGLFLFNACGSEKTVSPFVIDTVNETEVDSIQIIKPGRNNDADTVRRLTAQGIKDFLIKWNACTKGEPRKYLPSYILIVYRNGKNPKYFRTNQQHIKDEMTDWCADFGDSNYFAGLWTDKSVR